MLDLLTEDKHILNVDETWVGQTNFTRALWQQRISKLSEPENVVAPRISMIVALDNFGELYLELHQANTNSDSFCYFLVHLIEKLD